MPAGQDKRIASANVRCGECQHRAAGAVSLLLDATWALRMQGVHQNLPLGGGCTTTVGLSTQRCVGCWPAAGCHTTQVAHHAPMVDTNI